jgi:outer membrane protein OmpA-like peptidoglycan-associated protein
VLRSPHSRSSHALVLVALPVAVASGLLPAASAHAVASPQATTSVAWFHDPLTAAQRADLAPVPDHPRSVHGRLQRTRATYMSHGGVLAVPATSIQGHQLQQGQAVTLSRPGLFIAHSARPTPATRGQVAKLAASLAHVSAVSCEGYTDFSGDAAREGTLSRQRAARICNLLTSARPGLATTTHGFGRQVPVLVGGKPSQRAANRRVVVVATEDAPVSHTPPNDPPHQAPTPGAPTLSSVDTSGHWAQLHFAPPGNPGTSAITGYEWSTDGSTWTALDPDGSSSLAAWVSSLPTGTATYRVRAVNTDGGGTASNGVTGTISSSAVPDAPSWVGPYADCQQGEMYYSQINSNPVDPTATTGVQYSVDGGRTWVSPDQADLIAGVQWRFSLPDSTPACSTQMSIAIRFTSANGLGPASPFVDVQQEDD